MLDFLFSNISIFFSGVGSFNQRESMKDKISLLININSKRYGGTLIFEIIKSSALWNDLESLF